MHVMQTCTYMHMRVCTHTRAHTHAHTQWNWGLSACEWSFCNASRSPSSKPALFCGDPQSTCKTPDPPVACSPHARPGPGQHRFWWLPFPGQTRKRSRNQPHSTGAFMLYSGIKSVKCRNGPVRIISVYTRTPDPPINIPPHPRWLLWCYHM